MKTMKTSPSTKQGEKEDAFPSCLCELRRMWDPEMQNTRRNLCDRCNALTKTYPELAKQIHPDSPIKAEEVTAGSNKKLLWVCKEGHTWYARVNTRTKGGNGCRQCHHEPPIHKSLAYLYPDLAKQVHPDSPLKAHQVFGKAATVIKWLCSEGHTWESRVASRSNLKQGCPECSKSTATSQGERDVRNYLTTLLPAGMNVVANTRKIIRPLELDIYVPELKLAVEYNGTYWHSNEFILANRGITADEYHNNKKTRCEEQGVTLLFVEEHDWMANPEQVKQHLKTVVNTALTNTKTLVR